MARCLVEMAGGDVEHQVRQHRPGDAAQRPAPARTRPTSRGGRPAPAGARANQSATRDHRVEVAAGDRAEHQDEHEQPGRGRRRVLQQLQAGSSGDSCWAAIPEPTTTAARSALPRNSASSRRGSGRGTGSDGEVTAPS